MTCPGWYMTGFPPTVKEKNLSSFWTCYLPLLLTVSPLAPVWCRAEQWCANNPRGKVRVNKVNKATSLWNVLCSRPDRIGRKINGNDLQLNRMHIKDTEEEGKTWRNVLKKSEMASNDDYQQPCFTLYNKSSKNPQSCAMLLYTWKYSK